VFSLQPPKNDELRWTMYHTCKCCHEIWSVDARIIGQSGHCNGCGAFITITDDALSESAPPRLKTALRGLGVVLGWTFFLDCCFLIAPSMALLTEVLTSSENSIIADVALLIMLSAYAAPLLWALVIGLLLIGLIHVFNRYNASRFTACIRWATGGCLLFSISSVFLFGDSLMMFQPGYFSGRIDVGSMLDIAMKASLAGWIFGALLGACVWWLRRRTRHSNFRDDSPLQPLEAGLVPETLPKLGRNRRGSGG